MFEDFSYSLSTHSGEYGHNHSGFIDVCFSVVGHDGAHEVKTDEMPVLRRRDR